MSEISSIKDILTKSNKMDPKCPVKCSQCISETIKLCQRCLLVPYCAKECQLADWKTHKRFCAQVKEARNLYEPMVESNVEQEELWSKEFSQARYMLVLAVKDCSHASKFLPGLQLVLDNMLELLRMVEDKDIKETIKYSVPSILLAQEKPELAYSYIKFVSKKSNVDWRKFSIETLPKENIEETLNKLDVQQMKFQLLVDMCLAKIMFGGKLDKQADDLLEVIGKRKPEIIAILSDRSNKIITDKDEEVKEVLMNSYNIWQIDRCRQFLYKIEMKGAWAKGLAPAQAYEWLVDCYRMRLDDDYVWGGCNLRGLYTGEDDPFDIVLEFLAFCKLAKAKNVLPVYWDWKTFLSVAAKLLRYAFEKSDAQEKYGGENVFSAAMGGRSLRLTGELIYGSGVTEGTGEDQEKMMNKLNGRISKETTEDVGGEKIWKGLVKKIDSQF